MFGRIITLLLQLGNYKTAIFPHVECQKKLIYLEAKLNTRNMNVLKLEHSSERYEQLPETQKITFLSLYFSVKVFKVRHVQQNCLFDFLYLLCQKCLSLSERLGYKIIFHPRHCSWPRSYVISFTQGYKMKP